MESIRIVGIKVSPSLQDATKLQSVLTLYGNIIRTRLGLNEDVDEAGNRYGIILLELVGDQYQFNQLQNRLATIEGIIVKVMDF